MQRVRKSKIRSPLCTCTPVTPKGRSPKAKGVRASYLRFLITGINLVVHLLYLLTPLPLRLWRRTCTPVTPYPVPLAPVPFYPFTTLPLYPFGVRGTGYVHRGKGVRGKGVREPQAKGVWGDLIFNFLSPLVKAMHVPLRGTGARGYAKIAHLLHLYPEGVRA